MISFDDIGVYKTCGFDLAKFLCNNYKVVQSENIYIRTKVSCMAFLYLNLVKQIDIPVFLIQFFQINTQRTL